MPEAKAFEAGMAIEGAREVDIVINVETSKSKDYETVKRDIKAVVNTVR